MSAQLAALISPQDPVQAYLKGQMHASHGPLLEAFLRESDATVAAFGPALDVPYGPHPREVFDVYQSPQPWRGTLAYFHAGYWQSRDKAQFRFLAPAFLARGIDVVLVNYPLCPDVTLRDLVQSARKSIAASLAHRRDAGRGGASLVAAGHSAGGHLCAELAMTDWHARGMPASPIAGIIAISGVYELAPLVATPLNDKLRLDLDEAIALSPLRRMTSHLPPALFAVGHAETPAFQAQSQAMHEAWLAGGGDSTLSAAEGADHFSILRAFGTGGFLFSQAMDLFEEGHRHSSNAGGASPAISS